MLLAIHRNEDNVWVHQVKNNGDFNLKLSESEIRSMSEYKFRKLTKQKIEKVAFSYLDSRRGKKPMKSKIKRFECQEYVMPKI